MSKTLVIGLGNPILGDDGVGWKVAEALKLAIGDRSSVEVDCLAVGGLGLMERMLDHARVILIDSMETGQNPLGSVKTFPISDLPDPMAGHSASSHDASLMTALETAKALGADIPKQVDVVVLEIKNTRDFSESLSPAIEAAVPDALQTILKLLENDVKK